jgi:hypothetical protein
VQDREIAHVRGIVSNNSAGPGSQDSSPYSRN